MASKITKIIANFDTQLASTINIGGTTGSLKAPVADDDGVQAPDGKYVMCFDLGTSKEEHLLFDLVGSTGAMTNIKHVSKQGVETTGANIQHRTGSKASLTNFAILLYLAKLLSGETPLDATNPLTYDLAPTFNNALQLITKGYADTLSTTAIANLLAGNNIFTGINTFTQSPQVPNPVLGNDAVNLATLLATAFPGNSMVSGFTNFDLRYDDLGRIESAYDSVLNKVYFIKYRTDDIYVPYYIDTVDNFVVIGYDSRNLLSTGRKY